MDISANVGTNLGAPIRWTIAGKERDFSLVTQLVKAQVEQVLMNTARNHIKKDKDFMTDDEYGIAYGVFHERIVAGQYAFGSKIFRDWITTPKGMLILVGILCGDQETDWETMAFDDMLNVTQLVAAVMQASFPNLMKGKETSP